MRVRFPPLLQNYDAWCGKSDTFLKDSQIIDYSIACMQIVDNLKGMIKEQAYIRKFTPKQKALLLKLSDELKIKNAKDVLLFCLENRQDLMNENARLKRFLDLKQKKIEVLTEAQLK